MSPRRSGVSTFGPRRTRRGRDRPQDDRLAITTAPAGTYQNRVAGAGASVQLQDVNGQPLARAGVSVMVTALADVALAAAATPNLAVTDALGRAAFTALTVTGTAGSFSLMFSADGYASAVSAGHELVAGAPVAANSYANVPNGSAGQLTVVPIFLADADDNVVASQAPGTVTAEVTATSPVSTNPVPQRTIAFDAALVATLGTGYRFTYTPAAGGTDYIMARYAGTPIQAMPQASAVAPAEVGGFTPTSLRYGFHGMAHSPSNIGNGPHLTGGEWDDVQPIYRFSTDVYSNAATLIAAITTANAKNIVLGVRCSGAPSSYTDTISTDPLLRNFSWSKFTANVDRFDWPGWWDTAAQYQTWLTALATRRVFHFLTDEPWIRSYNDSFTPHRVRNCARYIKQLWPDSIVGARMEDVYALGHDNWRDENGDPTTGANALPPNYFDGIEYFWCTWPGLGSGRAKGRARLQYWNEGVAFNLAAGYWTILGTNWANLGDNTCWLAHGPGTTQLARIHGDAPTITGVGSGQIEDCPSTSLERAWLKSPDGIYADIATALQIDRAAYVPLVANWMFPAPGSIMADVLTDYIKRADYRAQITAALNLANTRTSFVGWRAPKHPPAPVAPY